MTGNAVRALLGPLRRFVLGVRRDRATGHLFYPVEGVRHFIRFPHEALRARDRRKVFEQVYFRHYRPSGGDCVVDFGAGLGTEIIPLARSAPGLRYLAVEIQPWVYECLCLTLAQLPPGFTAFGLAVGKAGEVRLTPSRQGDDVSTLGGGPVPVAGISWTDFVRRHALGPVSLLKMNVEGGEADLLDHLELDTVARAVVATHDFRADRGEGEGFRTRQRVEARLAGAGFRLKPLPLGWIYGERGS